MKSHPLRVLIVGCGNIAGLFDQHRRPGDFPLTHAGAFSDDARFSIAACVEPDDSRRNEFMRAWGVTHGARSIDELVSGGEQFDVISICSPTHCHAYDLEQAIQLKPKLVFCEKPVTTTLQDTQRLVEQYKSANIPLAVNYTRRWDPDVATLQTEISIGQRGQLRAVSGAYNKGILNNGSHMMDLLQLLLGPIEVIKAGKAVRDYSSDDPTIPVWLECEQGIPIHLTCGHSDDYALFELTLIFSKGVISMEDGGLFWRERPVIDSPTYRGYRKLGDGVRRTGKYPQAMFHAIENIYHAIRDGVPIVSTGESAVAAQRLCEQVKNAASSCL